jgi:hypothetical protein
MTGEYLDYGMTTSFQILSSSSFTIVSSTIHSLRYQKHCKMNQLKTALAIKDRHPY